MLRMWIAMQTRFTDEEGASLDRVPNVGAAAGFANVNVISKLGVFVCIRT